MNVVLCCGLQAGSWTELIVGLATIGAAVSVYCFNRSNRNLERDRMEKELFIDFNRRYDKLNESMNILVKFSTNDFNRLRDDLKHKLLIDLNDYFILCSEEYYWYAEKKHRVNDKVWKSWCVGMYYYYDNSKLIKELWKKEMAKGGYRSHYLAHEDELFNEIKKKSIE